MPETIKQIEAVPAAYPDVPGGLSDRAAMLDAGTIWARIESYTAHRFTVRQVIWTVEGAGDWAAPLTPANITGAEIWAVDNWADCTLSAGPYGLCLPDEGPFRITADVGGGVTPAPVLEAFRRLAEYLADEPDRAGVSQYSVNMGGTIEESYQRSAAWIARAMDYSGAADLLRPYRRA